LTEFKPQPRRSLPMFSPDDLDKLTGSGGVCELIGLKGRSARITLHRRMKKDPDFVRPVAKIGGRHYWLERAVREWIRGQIAEQAAASPPTRPRTRLTASRN
jgi:predicted DNA-binding transcriptional regulator AlpA